MVPILNEVSASLEDKIMIVKIDTEKYPGIADKYSIQALPTMIIFKDGKPCDRVVSEAHPFNCSGFHFCGFVILVWVLENKILVNYEIDGGYGVLN